MPRKFSLKRALGVSKAKRQFNKATGITGARKAERWMKNPLKEAARGAKARMSARVSRARRKGCGMALLVLILLVIPLVFIR